MPAEPPDAATPRILLVEDDAPTRRHLQRAIESHPALSLHGAAASCAEARALLEAGTPDVLLTDLGLPDGSGIELIRALRAQAPEALSMVITALGDEKTVLAAIEAGAAGYLLKDDGPEEVGDAVCALLDGGSPISPAIARTVLRRLQLPGPDASAKQARIDAAGDSAPSLSARETEVLKLIAKGFSFPEIARLLEISAHTVTTYVRRIYEKLEVSSRGSAVYEAVNLGLISMDD